MAERPRLAASVIHADGRNCLGAKVDDGDGVRAGIENAQVCIAGGYLLIQPFDQGGIRHVFGRRQPPPR